MYSLRTILGDCGAQYRAAVNAADAAPAAAEAGAQAPAVAGTVEAEGATGLAPGDNENGGYFSHAAMSRSARSCAARARTIEALSW